MACQFNSSETAALSQLDEYVRDALDLIDFANAPTSSPWGKLRADMGHPEPFHLTMIGVGNEQWGPRYVERYKIFAAALKAKHPEIQLVVAAGPAPAGEPFNTMWSTWRALHADIVDEHYYMSPEWFLTNTGRYDQYDRSGPKVFAGEYAAQSVASTSPDNHNNWKTALSEAAFMTGLERNGDVVQMASYAPLLAHVDAWQWEAGRDLVSTICDPMERPIITFNRSLRRTLEPGSFPLRRKLPTAFTPAELSIRTPMSSF